MLFLLLLSTPLLFTEGKVLKSDKAEHKVTEAIACPPRLKAFSCFPSEDCPTDRHFYECKEGWASLQYCPDSSYDPSEDGCAKPSTQSIYANQTDVDSFERIDAEPSSRSVQAAQTDIEVDSLGRNIQIGHLYYGTIDKVATDESLWTKESLEKRRIENQQTSDYKVHIAESTLDRANELDITANLFLSFYAGKIEIKGSAKYLEDRKKKKNEVSVSLIYNSRNKQESLTQELREKLDYPKVCELVGKKNGPTHVVSSIVRGFRGVFNFRKSLEESDKKSEIAGELEVTIKSVPGVVIKGDAKLDIKEKEKNMTKNLEVNFWGDAILNHSVTSYEDAVKVFKDFSTYAKTSNSVVSFGLSPIKKYCNEKTAILNSLSNGLQIQMLEALQDLEQLEVEVDALLAADSTKAFPASIGTNINTFKRKLTTFSNEFKQNFGKVLPEVRGGGAGELKLVKMLNALQASIFEKGRAMAFLDRRHKEVGTIDLYMRHRGAPGTGIVVEEDGSAEGNKCRIDFTFLVEFNLPVLPEQDVIHNYLESGKGKEHEQKYHDSEEEYWYNDETDVKVTGELYKRFVDFQNLNKEMDDSCYLVSLEKVDKKSKPSIKIVGRDAETITNSFKTPRKKTPLGQIDVTSDSIEFEVATPYDGVMNKLEIIYEQLGKDPVGDAKRVKYPSYRHQIDVKKGEDKTKISLTKLQPGTNYMIKIRTFSERYDIYWAVGPFSDPLTVTTSSSSPPGHLTFKNKTDTLVSLTWVHSVFNKNANLSIEYRVDTHLNECTSKKIMSDVTADPKLVLKPLQPATKYCFTVTAVPKPAIITSCNSKGEKGHLKTFDCVPNMSANFEIHTAPSPPTEFEAIKVTESTVSLQWGASKIAPGSNLIGYVVEFVRVDDDTKEELFKRETKKSSTNKLDISALVSGATFRFRVMVRTSAGDSDWSSPESAKTKGGSDEKTGELMAAIKTFKKELEGKIDGLQTGLSTETKKVESLDKGLATVSKKGAHCAYTNHWDKENKIITYTRLLIFKGFGSMDIKQGRYTAKQKGIYQITWALRMQLDHGEQTFIFLHKNDNLVSESEHHSNLQGDKGRMLEQGGRTMLMELDNNDYLYLRAQSFGGEAFHMTFCVSLLSAIE